MIGNYKREFFVNRGKIWKENKN